jgi:hypothetical protein
MNIYIKYSIFIRIKLYSRAFASIPSYVTVDLDGKEKIARSALGNMDA